MTDETHIERAVLGAMLLDAVAISDATAKLKASDFVLDSHRRIYSAILSAAEDGLGVDYNTVSIALRTRKELDTIGGIGYLTSLCDGLPRNFNIESYVRIVKDSSRKRQGINEFELGKEALIDGGEDTQKLLEGMAQRIHALIEDDDDFDMQLVGDYLSAQGESEDAVRSMMTAGGLKLGWSQWDDTTGGIQRGELLILAAMASAGKTAWACNAVHHTSVIGGKVTAFFPLEQKRASAIRRILSAASRIQYRDIRDGNLTNYDRGVLLDHRLRLSSAPLYVDDTPSMTMTRIKAKCSRLKRQMLTAGHPTGLDFVMIDQLSHVDNSDVWQKNFSAEELLGKQAHGAKRIAEELDVPVCLLAQMTQEGAKRTDPRPRLTDIAGSGKIKNHADIVAFLHRPWMYDKTADEKDAEMILAKNREGATKTIPCEYLGKIMRWQDSTEPVAQQDSMDGYY